MLEAARLEGRRIPVIFAGTTRVYGALSDLPVRELEDRYVPVDDKVARLGLAEDCEFDCSTPFGCSKGIADQYVRDYAASYGVPTAVLRFGTVYGPVPDGADSASSGISGLIARAVRGEAIRLPGGGKKVRDLLHVDDAAAACRAALGAVEMIAGRAFNVGGGPANAASRLMVLEEIAAITGLRSEVVTEPAHPADPPYFVSDSRRILWGAGWRPKVGWRDGLQETVRSLTVGGALPLAAPAAGLLSAGQIGGRKISA
ncbi:CDP-paratose 2-epimerase [Methylobrevis pamukkalensis]|uniref:CDP-paratose 2-epimerase n=1 Tax=Methylobrevis pamukkalensis TaxID=1439726 RepID=A0A1E3H292_9HYPH|nr:CDP-paratose 2-epimerase [Methylobrevis pamukkalensis]